MQRPSSDFTGQEHRPQQLIRQRIPPQIQAFVIVRPKVLSGVKPHNLLKNNHTQHLVNTQDPQREIAAFEHRPRHLWHARIPRLDLSHQVLQLRRQVLQRHQRPRAGKQAREQQVRSHQHQRHDCECGNPEIQERAEHQGLGCDIGECIEVRVGVVATLGVGEVLEDEDAGERVEGASSAA
jgi:hypothetical protein